ncbi:hypothetical protein K505DRAFT_364628 [Melanomma pulvis-pyrius CBS 109.77]|uniref:Uncharacterized protein n=1 Tax=Melanomma pulvis-pyrius CBS 109.77 TaxID=1314802 RepID=A0A6A6X349_9PLEO|nr:hypothetical protein K505DRAFT_364628 [Melanomma pulvis-pyrius CBS 109.77]
MPSTPPSTPPSTTPSQPPSQPLSQDPPQITLNYKGFTQTWTYPTVSSLPDTSRNCSVCLVPYDTTTPLPFFTSPLPPSPSSSALTPLSSDPSSAIGTPTSPPVSNPDSGLEYPVRMNLPDCKHVFGHLCLAICMGTDTAWRNKCPICRTLWFQGPVKVRKMTYWISGG